MAVKFQDYYETLGVARDATPEAIKLSYRKLARLYHPDVAKNKVTGEAKFKEINEAYEVLGDPEKRKHYDDVGSSRNETAGSPFGTGAGYSTQTNGDAGGFEFHGTGFSDFYEAFFGGGRARRNRQDGSRGDEFPENGADVEADLLVTLNEALHGAVRKVTLRRPEADGASGRTDTYQVRIPPGVHEGQRIRLAGQGEPGHGGAGKGDLYLRVRLARHPDFRVVDGDIYHDLQLAPWEAVLGTKVNVPTLDGVRVLRVPPGTNQNSQLRLRGHGLPKKANTRGDYFAVINIRIPDVVSAAERALWEQLSKLSEFNPRG